MVCFVEVESGVVCAVDDDIDIYLLGFPHGRDPFRHQFDTKSLPRALPQSDHTKSIAMSSTEAKPEVSNDDFGVHQSTSGDEEKHRLGEPALVPTPEGQTVRGLKSRHIQFL